MPGSLARKLRDKLGSETGEELVTWLAEMRAQHQEQIGLIDARMQASETRLLDGMHDMETRLMAHIHALDVRVGDVQSNLMKWSFVFWCGAVAAIAALAGVLRG